MPKIRQTSMGPLGHAGAGGSDLPIRARPLPLSQSEASLPVRRSTPNSAAASLYASTLTPPESRSMSPVGGVRAGSPAGRTLSMTSNASIATTASASSATTITAPSSQRPSSSSSAAAAATPGAAYARSLLDLPAAENPGDPLNLVLKAFVPHVAVYSSSDTDALAREKGFPNGLWELLRPFGERVAGRVHVRDSNGAPRPWDDFSVRFTKFGDNIEAPESAQGIIQPPTSPPPQLVNDKRFLRRQRGSSSVSHTSHASSSANGGRSRAGTADARSNATAARIPIVEAIVDKHLTYAESAFSGLPPPPPTPGQGPPPPQQQQQQQQQQYDVDGTSPYYALYLRRMLSGLPVACHETFAHPVACVIAISSRNPAPIQTFQELYRDISQGDRRLPPWVDGDFLRYYVLVHDEENGDIVQSMALFEKMKRSLGLHCHLLRLRSTQSAETDDDSLLLPRSDWMTAVEEYADLVRSEAFDEGDVAASEAEGGEDEQAGGSAAADNDIVDDPTTRYIFESDATAIRTFVREMVTQSILPTMERSVSLWNDQVASKRKGLSGRFMSLSKRWAGFGSSNNSNSSNGGGRGDSGSSNYDAARGYYGAEASEAILRKLADYAFMLRDWKLAMSTYDILRTDYTNDKAWKYHAAANEMCALSLLIMPPSLSSRTKLDSISSMLEQAFYSYHTRCGSAYGATRVVALSLELQRLRGGAFVDEAVRWGMRLLDARLVGHVGDPLLRERMAVCCATRAGRGSLGWGTWRRKSAFWSVLAAEAWVAQAKYIQAQRCLNEARRMYSMLQSDDGINGFARARDYMAGLQQQLKHGLLVAGEAAAAAVAEHATEAGADVDLAASTTTVASASSAAGGGEPADMAAADPETEVDVEEVQLAADETSLKNARRRSRRDSLLGGSGAGQAGLESAPLRTRRLSAAAEHEDDVGQDESGFGQV
ncbi:hypothetical protein SPBR_02311 [Sporothrix brasiliensis 5110]|uniref:TRAPP complex protein TRS85 n=1 Tax=Sporothrix brasiliensis 5110 TaxID=1398154 RepID=A0A0C2FMF6_9PEZI|nr:uncharacterized protein SPBR_02311 [Sporothrix brasiliensis 5110]KIH92253.1 hypothetical protein SPBR_02311 [Sporothrix brasiliensis 5110]